MSTNVAAEAGPARPERAMDAVVRQVNASPAAPPTANTTPSDPIEVAPSAPTATNVTEPPPPPPPAAPASGWAPSQEATVSIPRLGTFLPVHTGGQAVIDQGVAAHYTGPVSRPAVALGDMGTYWLAGHHATHGKPFARVPELVDGDLVMVTSRQGASFTFTITSTQVVGTKTPRTTIYGTDPSARRILLQTCLGSTRRFLAHGTLTSVS